MIIKKITILECWCPNCGKGQMEQIYDTSWLMKQRLYDWVGREVECENCKQKNTIEDIFELVPTAFNIHSHNDINKLKMESSLDNHLNKP